MKRLFILGALSIALAAGCKETKPPAGNQPATSGAKGAKGAKTSKGGGKGKTVVAAAEPAPEVKTLSRDSSSSNPQAVAAFKEGVALLEKIRKEGTGSYDAAIGRLNSATSMDGNFAEAWYNLGAIYEDLSKYDKAEDSFARSARANPALTEANASLGRIYMLRGNMAKAKEFYNERLVKEPKNKDLRNKLAEAYRVEKNYPGALDQIKQVLFADPDNVEAYKTLSLVFMDQGKYDMAKLTCANALKIDPDNAGVYNNLGLIYLKQGDIRLAAAQFTKALEKDPGFAPSLANLGAIALDHKDYGLANETFGKLARIKPSNIQALNAQAVALRGLKKFDEAKALYMRVHELDGSYEEVSYNLGVLHALGYKEPKTALRYFQDYIGKVGITDPKHPVFALVKRCEEDIKREEMMNAPAPSPTPTPADKVADPNAPKEEGGGTKTDGAAKGTSPTAAKAEGGGKIAPAANQ